jgi:hypothetical protein
MPSSGEADGRTWVDGCESPRTDSWRLSGASTRLLPRTVPPCLIKNARLATAWIFVLPTKQRRLRFIPRKLTSGPKCEIGREWDGPAALPPPTALRVRGGLPG